MPTETKPTFTPGPWRVVQGHGCLHAVSADGTFSTGCISFRGNGEANARLIVAAPDLYALVRYVYDTLGSGAPLYNTARLHEQLTAVLQRVDG